MKTTHFFRVFATLAVITYVLGTVRAADDATLRSDHPGVKNETDDKQSLYKLLREKKLRSEFLTKASWLTDLDKAKAESKQRGHPIFAYLTRSFSYCPYCAATEHGVLSDPSFPAFAKNFILLCHVTSKVNGDSYPELLTQTGGDGFPHIVIIDADGAVLARCTGQPTIPEFEKMAARAIQLSALHDKATSGDSKAKFDYLVARGELDAWREGEQEKLRAELGALSQEQQLLLDVTPIRGAVAVGDWDKVLTLADRLLKNPNQDARQEAVECKAVAYWRTNAPEAALVWGMMATENKPDSLRGNYVVSNVAYQQGILPLAANAIRPVIAKKPNDPLLQTIVNGLAKMGREDYQQQKPVNSGNLQLIPYKFAATKGKPAAEEQWFLLKTKGVMENYWVNMTQSQIKEKSVCNMYIGSFGGTFLARSAHKMWTAADASDIIIKSKPMIPLLGEIESLKKKSQWPLAAAKIAEASKLDPDFLEVHTLNDELKWQGWDSYETTTLEPSGKLEATIYRANGTGSTGNPMTVDAVAVFSDKGKPDHIYCQRGKAPHCWLYLTDSHDITSIIRQWDHPPSKEEIAQAVSATEQAAPQVAKARELFEVATETESTADFLTAAAAWRAVLQQNPFNVDSAEQLLRCYLFISDKEVSTQEESMAYNLGMGSIEFLKELNPDSLLGHMALGVFAYRFGAYPLAVEHLTKAEESAAFKNRALEIIGILKAIDQAEYRQVEAFDVGKFRIQSYERVPSPAAPPPPDGTRIAEQCFIGTLDGNYRFNFTCRLQSIGGQAQHELVFSRCNLSVTVKNFEQSPSLQQLKDEISQVLASLTSK